MRQRQRQTARAGSGGDSRGRTAAAPKLKNQFPGATKTARPDQLVDAGKRPKRSHQRPRRQFLGAGKPVCQTQPRSHPIRASGRNSNRRHRRTPRNPNPDGNNAGARRNGGRMEVTSHALATSQSLSLDPAIGPPSPAPRRAREQFVDAGEAVAKTTRPKPGRFASSRRNSSNRPRPTCRNHMTGRKERSQRDRTQADGSYKPRRRQAADSPSI